MKKIKSICLSMFVWLMFFIWKYWNRFYYLTQVKYASRDVKKLIKKTPCILIANHTAHADGYVLPHALPARRLYTYVTRKWYDKPKLNWMFANAKYVPIDLTSMNTDWLERGEDLLARGNSVLIFPEGKLGEVGSLGEFHPGALMLAKKTGVPVIPVALFGDYHAFCRKRILVGDPLSLSLNDRGRPSVILRRETEKCHTAMREMLNLPPLVRADLDTEEVPTEVKIPAGVTD